MQKAGVSPGSTTPLFFSEIPKELQNILDPPATAGLVFLVTSDPLGQISRQFSSDGYSKLGFLSRNRGKDSIYLINFAEEPRVITIDLAKLLSDPLVEKITFRPLRNVNYQGMWSMAAANILAKIQAEPASLETLLHYRDNIVSEMVKALGLTYPEEILSPETVMELKEFSHSHRKLAQREALVSQTKLLQQYCSELFDKITADPDFFCWLMNKYSEWKNKDSAKDILLAEYSQLAQAMLKRLSKEDGKKFAGRFQQLEKDRGDA